MVGDSAAEYATGTSFAYCGVPSTMKPGVCPEGADSLD